MKRFSFYLSFLVLLIFWFLFFYSLRGSFCFLYMQFTQLMPNNFIKPDYGFLVSDIQSYSLVTPSYLIVKLLFFLRCCIDFLIMMLSVSGLICCFLFQNRELIKSPDSIFVCVWLFFFYIYYSILYLTWVQNSLWGYFPYIIFFFFSFIIIFILLNVYLVLELKLNIFYKIASFVFFFYQFYTVLLVFRGITVYHNNLYYSITISYYFLDLIQNQIIQSFLC